MSTENDKYSERQKQPVTGENIKQLTKLFLMTGNSNSLRYLKPNILKKLAGLIVHDIVRVKWVRQNSEITKSMNEFR